MAQFHNQRHAICITCSKTMLHCDCFLKRIDKQLEIASKTRTHLGEFFRGFTDWDRALLRDLHISE